MMSPLMNDNLIQALCRQPVKRTPIWVMRQAGRYLPEYRKLREKAPNFMTFCKTPDMACEATLQPLRRFDLDAAIIFSDILTIPEAMGMDLQFLAGEGPKFLNPLRHEQEINQLKKVDVDEQLGYVRDAIALTVKELDGKVPLIGFSGSPWTLAAYMIEGSGSKTFFHPRAMAYHHPDLLHELLTRLTHIIIDYLNMQVKAGARVLMVFDSWGGLLSPQCFRQLSLNYLKHIAANVMREYQNVKIPLIFFSKDANGMLEELAVSGCDALGCDWKIDLKDARQRVGHQVALQGNLDPAIMLTSPDIVQREAQRVLQSYGHGPGHVFNLGHGIDQKTPIDHMTALVECVHAWQ